MILEETTSNTQYGSIKISQVVKILIAGIGQSALLDSVERTDFDKTKKMLGRIKTIDDNDSKTSFKQISEFENLLLIFGSWAMMKGYIKSCSFIVLFYYELKSMIHEIDNPLGTAQENVQNHLLFSIRNILVRFFTDMNENYPNTYETEAFVRFDGTDVVFTNYIVHEDGSYERITDKTEESYNNNAMDDDPWLSLVWYEDDSLYVEDTHGNRYDLGVSAKDIENLGYGISHGVEVLDDNFYISFNSDQDDSNACLCYWGKLTDNGIVGGFVYAKVLDQPEYSIEITANSPREFVDFWYKDEYILCVDYDYEYFLSKYNDETQNFTIDQIPLDYDKLTAATKSGPEYQTLYDCCGEKITLLITYYPSDCFRAATPDSAD